VTLDQRGYMPIDDARALLCRDTDVVVAMGTSALDIASAGHPVILIDPAFARRFPPQRLFRFCHEVDDFTLGEFRDSSRYATGLRTFADCIEPAMLAEAEISATPYDTLAQRMRDIDRSFARISPRYAMQQRRSR
jgi:hypothetical protein